LVCTQPPHTHQSIIKAAQVLEIKTLYIEANEDGSMNVNNLRGKLAEMKDQPYINFIVSLNFGTTYGPAFDDVFEVRKAFDESKNDEWKYVVNVDAAMYGPTLPILK
jgi:glutamate/tyrosine decarboxylase-like PLP-dependent enzyme